MSLCSVSGCGRESYRRGMCNTHHLRVKRRGTTERDPEWIRGLHCKKKTCPAAKKLAAQLEYLQKSELFKARAAQWQKTGKGKEYLKSEKVKAKARARTKEWSAENQERKAVTTKQWRKKNRALVRSYQSRYRAAVLKATPPWLTAAMLEEIRTIYAEAERITKLTGTEHEVDHIVPLQGKTVCGLHVPWNLRVIPAVENNRRPRVWMADDAMIRLAN